MCMLHCRQHTHTCNNYTSTTAREHRSVKYTTTAFTPSTPHYTSPHLTLTTTAVRHYPPPAWRTVSLTTRAPDEVNVETCFLFFALSVKRYRDSGFSLKEREEGEREAGKEGGRGGEGERMGDGWITRAEEQRKSENMLECSN